MDFVLPPVVNNVLDYITSIMKGWLSFLPTQFSVANPIGGSVTFDTNLIILGLVSVGILVIVVKVLFK